MVNFMRRLKNNKAMDSLGLTSEHLKLGERDLAIFLSENLNYMVSS